jgi:hypothetical protein
MTDEDNLSNELSCGNAEGYNFKLIRVEKN